MADPSDPGISLGSVTVKHHRTPRAEITADVLSGGHVLHLAVAACLFNDILRLATERGIGLAQLRVSAGGGFDANGSTGVGFAVDIAGDVPDDQLRALVDEAERDATIPAALRRGTSVTAERITVGR